MPQVNDQIKNWNDIKEDYQEGLIVGNGGSIAVSDLFNYTKLYDKALECGFIDENLRKVFQAFFVHDFELVLNKLIQTKKVNEAFDVTNSKIDNAYKNCRNSLIKTVHKVHPKFEKIRQQDLKNISEYIKPFKVVISLNYDLILYWVMNEGNKSRTENKVRIYGNRFKDGFLGQDKHGNIFEFDWDFLCQPYGNRNGATLIFYQHGNITLANVMNEFFQSIECKVVSGDKGHLDFIYDKWNCECYAPLFICEGDSDKKLSEIKLSPYLSTIYNEVFYHLGSNIAIYGWSFRDEDQHILDRLQQIHKQKGPDGKQDWQIKKIAISVHQGNGKEDFMKTASEKIKMIAENIEVEFYDAASQGCWNH